MRNLITPLVLAFFCTNLAAMNKTTSLPRLVAEENQRLFIRTTTAAKMDKPAAGADLGYVLSGGEVDQSFFVIRPENINLLPKKVKRIYTFIEEHGFINRIGYIVAKQLLQEQISNKQLLKVKKQFQAHAVKSQIKDTDKLTIIPYKTIPNGVFHNHESGLFFRNHTNLASISDTDPHIKWLFQENDELADLLKEAVAINQRIMDRQNVLKEILSNKGLPSDILRTLAASEATPNLIKHRVNTILEKRVTELAKAPYVKELRGLLKNSMDACDARIGGLSSISPAPLDMALLYAFYLFEDSRKLLFDIEDYMDFISPFTDEEGLSIMTLLSPNALEVFTWLGFDQQQKKSATVEKKVSKPEPKEQKPQPEKRNKPRRPKPSQTVVEILSDDNIISVVTKAPEIIIHQPSTIIVDEDDAEIIPIKNLDAYAPPSKTGVWLNSLKNDMSAKNLVIKRTKGHRLLDTLARLISYEMGQTGFSPGSLSIALIKSGDGSDKLLITTKYDVSEFQIRKSLDNVVRYSRQLTKKVDDQIAFIETEKAKIEQTWEAALTTNNEHELFELSKQRTKARNNIDKIKFTVAITDGHTDKIATRFINIFVDNNYQQRIKILGNPFRYHSEINAINYLKANQLSLSTTASATGRNIPYQYIGGSILSCGLCSSLIRGNDGISALNAVVNESNMAFFMRGHYEISYPGYTIPNWALGLNKCNGFNLEIRLKPVNPPRSSVSRLQLHNCQEADLSDSDDD